MSFQEVLDLTPFQVAALLAEKSTPPGELDPDVYSRIVRQGVQQFSEDE